MATFAIGGPYATRTQLKALMGIPDGNTARDAELDRKLASSAQDINRWCHRQFGRAETATGRTFFMDRCGIDVHDFWDLATLVVQEVATDGSLSAAWDVNAMTITPLDGVVDQVPGWPYNRIEQYGSELATHPMVQALNYRGAKARVTAKWGWEVTPENITTSNLMLAAADDKAKDAPFGVAGFGDYAIRIRSNGMVVEKLAPYVIDELQVVG
jgi:hypothetical protein